MGPDYCMNNQLIGMRRRRMMKKSKPRLGLAVLRIFLLEFLKGSKYYYAFFFRRQFPVAFFYLFLRQIEFLPSSTIDVPLGC
jgi:hypothetical protein